MALTDWYSNIHLLFRWLHVIAGIAWIGHLYFFNFVNLPLQATLDDAGKKAVNPKLMPRALWWFRWGAMVTFVAGLVLFVMSYFYTPGVGFGASNMMVKPEGGMTTRAIWILLGMLFGIIMWFNVWMIIWPTQKRILSGQVPQDQLPAQRKKAALFSRINTYLSAPMLFGMLAPAHYGAINAVTAIVAIALGMAVIWMAYRLSSRVGTSV
jgi:uncharacterized membrane protein